MRLFQVIIFIILGKVHCRDFVVQINSKRAVNSISENFIGYSIDSKNILDGFLSNLMNNGSELLERLGPGVLVINFEPELLYNLSLERIESSNVFGREQLKLLDAWSKKNGFQNVFRLDYVPGQWKPKENLQLFGVADDLDIDCAWQFGGALTSRSVKQYIRDFNTLSTVAGVLPTRWSVLPAPFNQNFSIENLEMIFHAIKDDVKGFSYTRQIDDTTNIHALMKETSVKYLLRPSKKITFMPTFKPRPLNGYCDATCINDALTWAQLIGESAENGFDTIIKPLEKTDFIQPHFKYLINLLFKQLVGTKVLDVFGIKDKESVKPYAFCSKSPGSVVVMLINTATEKARIQLKLQPKIKRTIFEYIVSACEGKICLNRNKPQHNMEPVELRAKSVEIPASSVAFYVVPDADFSACNKETRKMKRENIASDEKDSMNDLLKDLVAESLNHVKVELKSRKKRHLHHLPDLFHPKRLDGLRDRHRSQKVHIPGIGDIETSIEDKSLKSSEIIFPEGEVHLNVAKNNNEDEPDYDYVAFDTTPTPKKKKSKKTRAKKEEHKVKIENEGSDHQDNVMVFDFGEEFARQKPNFEELELSSKQNKKTDRIKTQVPKDMIKHAVLVKDEPPTSKQNEENYKKAKERIEQFQIGAFEELQPELQPELQKDPEDYINEGEGDEEDKLTSEENNFDMKTKRHSDDNQIEEYFDDDEVKDEKFMTAFARLLRKMEQVFAAEEELQGSRTRRQVESVQVPRRRMRKDITQKEKKKQTKREPVDIKDLGTLIRPKRSFILPPEIEKMFYENNNNEIADDDGFEIFVEIPEEEEKKSTEEVTTMEEVTTTTEEVTTTTENGKTGLFNRELIESMLNPVFELIFTVRDSTREFVKKWKQKSF